MIATVLMAVAGQAAAIPNQPVTAASQAEVAELIRIADSIDRATDNRDWATARSFFADRVRTDFTSLSGQPPAEIAGAELVGAWEQNLTGGKTSFHMRTNHLVRIDGDRAMMQSAGYAWNRMEGQGEPLWEVWGVYEHSFVRTPGGWKVSGMALKVTHQRGNFWVRDTPGR